MISPIAGVALRGVALNIGLGNAPRATQARALLPALIQDWRQAWGRTDVPFVLLQQGHIGASNLDPRASTELRAAQAAAENGVTDFVLISLCAVGDAFR